VRTAPYRVAGYEQWIRFEGKRIFRFNCTCPDFVFRRVQTKEPCKHIGKILKMIDLKWVKGGNFKVGIIKLNEKQKRVLRELTNFTCENCGEKEDKCGKLQPHRLTRGVLGGTYVPSNVKMYCDRCHKDMHGGEFT